MLYGYTYIYPVPGSQQAQAVTVEDVVHVRELANGHTILIDVEGGQTQVMPGFIAVRVYPQGDDDHGGGDDHGEPDPEPQPDPENVVRFNLDDLKRQNTPAN